MGKIIHRYDCDKIRSADLFIYHRLCLNVGSKVQIYSKSNTCWCNGQIIKIKNKHLFKVMYGLQNKHYYNYVDRWSSLIRLDTEIDSVFYEHRRQLFISE